MSEQLSIPKLVTERLGAVGVAYMLTGSIAAVYYAEPRMARDIDPGVGLRPHNDRLAAISGLELTLPAD